MKLFKDLDVGVTFINDGTVYKKRSSRTAEINLDYEYDVDEPRWFYFGMNDACIPQSSHNHPTRRNKMFVTTYEGEETNSTVIRINETLEVAKKLALDEITKDMAGYLNPSEISLKVIGDGSHDHPIKIRTLVDNGSDGDFYIESYVESYVIQEFIVGE